MRQDSTPHAVTSSVSRELQRYLDSSGRVALWPAKRSTRLEAFLYLTALFEPGRLYSEREVNTLLASRLACQDYATIRRDLCDFRYLKRKRDGSCYWRAIQE